MPTVDLLISARGPALFDYAIAISVHPLVHAVGKVAEAEDVSGTCSVCSFALNTFHLLLVSGVNRVLHIHLPRSLQGQAESLCRCRRTHLVRRPAQQSP